MDGSPLVGVLTVPSTNQVVGDNTNHRETLGLGLLYFGKQYLSVIGRFSPFLRSISGKKLRSPLVGVLTVPSTIKSLVGDNTNHREGLFYLGLCFMGTDSPVLLRAFHVVN